jgi:type VI secretion system protein ImpF
MKGLARRNERAADGPAVRLSVLDRLIDEAPDKPDEPTLSNAEAVAHLRSNLRRDLEALLNAHHRWRSIPQGYDELPRSPLAWGIADFTAGGFNDPRKREELRTEIENAIRTFETRLARVRVTLLEPNNTLSATLRLRIDGLLRVETEAEPIAFDTLINAASPGVKVEANLERLRSPDDV